jgi:hypothetical protein
MHSVPFSFMMMSRSMRFDSTLHMENRQGARDARKCSHKASFGGRISQVASTGAFIPVISAIISVLSASEKKRSESCYRAKRGDTVRGDASTRATHRGRSGYLRGKAMTAPGRAYHA